MKTVTVTMANLEPAAMQVLRFLQKTGKVDAVDALIALGGMSSASLARRITDLDRAGIPIRREQKVNAAGREYTRYVLSTN